MHIRPCSCDLTITFHAKKGRVRSLDVQVGQENCACPFHPKSIPPLEWSIMYIKVKQTNSTEQSFLRS